MNSIRQYILELSKGDIEFQDVQKNVRIPKKFIIKQEVKSKEPSKYEDELQKIRNRIVKRRGEFN